VKVTAKKENGQLEIAVEDSGSGVPEELREKIFEPFVSSRSNGSGLGLAIARESSKPTVELCSASMPASAPGSRYEYREVYPDIPSARLRIRDSVLFEFCVEKLPVDVEQASRLSTIAVGFSVSV
jgi:Histidine kinase-, DNA gyrase B-, and HSP90-like ATPase